MRGLIVRSTISTRLLRCRYNTPTVPKSLQDKSQYHSVIVFLFCRRTSSDLNSDLMALCKPLCHYETILCSRPSATLSCSRTRCCIPIQISGFCFMSCCSRSLATTVPSTWQLISGVVILLPAQVFIHCLSHVTPRPPLQKAGSQVNFTILLWFIFAVHNQLLLLFKICCSVPN